MDKSLTAHDGRRAHKEDGVTWYEAAAGERIAVRLSSLDKNGAYAVVESIAAPRRCVPMHLHQNEEEHFVILAGTYRFACEDKIFEAIAGTSVTVPKGARHSWRNLSDHSGRMLIVLTPGGFEGLVQEAIDAPADKIEEVAARYGCFIVGPAVNA